uniref:Uncharacterized protein n=1 Tax=Arundo donax TaxID=35708 RepID=A0A0A9GM95_ARUDO
MVLVSQNHEVYGSCHIIPGFVVLVFQKTPPITIFMNLIEINVFPKYSSAAKPRTLWKTHKHHNILYLGPACKI